MQEFEARYNEMGKSAMAPQVLIKKGKANGLKKLIHETQSFDLDEDIGNPAQTALPDSAKPWWAGFMNYLDMLDAKPPPGMSTIQWWGVCTSFSYVYPVTHPFGRSMHRDMGRCGRQLLKTFCLSWHHPSQVSELFLRVG